MIYIFYFFLLSVYDNFIFKVIINKWDGYFFFKFICGFYKVFFFEKIWDFVLDKI